MRHTVRYMISLPGRHGPRFFWQPSAALRRAGWRAVRLPDDAAAAMAEAERRNAELDRWRAGQAAAPDAPAAAPAGTTAAVIASYRASAAYAHLRARTRRDYDSYLALIHDWAGDAPITAIDSARAHRLYERYRVATPTRAAYLLRVLSILFNHARRALGIKVDNVAGGPQTKVSRGDVHIWSAEEVSAMVATADALGWHSMGTAILLNSWLGQRQGDVLGWPRDLGHPGAELSRQSKRGAVAALPLWTVPALRDRAEAERARTAALAVVPATLLVCETTGRPWREDHFRHVFAAVRAEAARRNPPMASTVRGLLFAHLRHTAMTRLFEAGVDVAGVAAISGHSLASAKQVMDRHYLVRTTRLAEGALRARARAEGHATTSQEQLG